MKRTLAGIAMVVAVLMVIAATTGGKSTRGRYGHVAGGQVWHLPAVTTPAR